MRWLGRRGGRKVAFGQLTLDLLDNNFRFKIGALYVEKVKEVATCRLANTPSPSFTAKPPSPRVGANVK